MRSLLAIMVILTCPPIPALPVASPPWVIVAKDSDGLYSASLRPVIFPWSFNCDRDYKFRLIEDHWNTKWAMVEQDFRERKKPGANVARVHLQFNMFMDRRDKPNQATWHG